MNRINEKGIQMIQYKTELLKDYPKLVKDSMFIALEQMLESGIIDLDTLQMLKDESFDLDRFDEYILGNANFSKTKEELLKEFEMKRLELDILLSENGLPELATESNVEKDAISMGLKFFIGEEFARAYFGIDEKDIDRLMKRKGFVETFAVLRLTAIFNDVLRQLPTQEFYKIDSSLVYFDNEGEGYNIDLIFEIPVDSLDFEKTEEMVALIDTIKSSVESAKQIYSRKMEI